MFSHVLQLYIFRYTKSSRLVNPSRSQKPLPDLLLAKATKAALLIPSASALSVRTIP